jgi:hypothetical protein
MLALLPAPLVARSGRRRGRVGGGGGGGRAGRREVRGLRSDGCRMAGGAGAGGRHTVMPPAGGSQLVGQVMRRRRRCSWQRASGSGPPPLPGVPPPLPGVPPPCEAVHSTDAKSGCVSIIGRCEYRAMRMPHSKVLIVLCRSGATGRWLT